MGELTVLGLGVWPEHLSLQAQNALQSGSQIVLQTEHCYAPAWLQAQTKNYTTLDKIYSCAQDFDEFTCLTSAELLRMARDADVVLAVMGSPCGLPLVDALRQAAGKAGIPVRILPGISYGEAALCAAAADLDLSPGYLISFASNMSSVRIDTNKALCLQELDTRILAGDVKLALMEYYPDEWPLIIAIQDGSTYQCAAQPLFTLDQLEENAYSHTTCLIAPPVPFEALERYGEEDLAYILKRLRAPDGCPWDRVQTHATLRTDLLEETYELIEAIDAQDDGMLIEELGDVFMQVYFHACIAQEQARFTMRDICTGICKKLIYRHPHVFGSAKLGNTEDVLQNWEQLKRSEKKQRNTGEAMAAISKALPALIRAQKLQRKAAGVGFDWPDASSALEKVLEECGEFVQEMSASANGEKNDKAKTLEFGDILFSLVNVARLTNIDAELALMAANEKFFQRFCSMEAHFSAEGKRISDQKSAELDAIWERVKNKK